MTDDGCPEALAAIAGRLGLPTHDLSAPVPQLVRTADGLAINLVDWGGAGTPAVLAHGGSLTARTWDYLALALRSRFRLIAPDLRGHGSSDGAEAYPMAG